MISSTQCMNPYAQRSAELDAEGDAQRALAKQDLREAGQHAVAAVAHGAGAAVNLALAAGKTVQGTARTVKSAGHLAAAAGLGATAAAAWAAEQALDGARFVARSAAKGFAGLANALARATCDGRRVAVTEVQAGPSGTRISTRLRSAAGRQVEKSGEALAGAGRSYAQAVAHVAGSAVNLGCAAGHTLAVAGNLAQAAGRSNTALRLELAERDARLWERTSPDQPVVEVELEVRQLYPAPQRQGLTN